MKCHICHQIIVNHDLREYPDPFTVINCPTAQDHLFIEYRDNVVTYYDFLYQKDDTKYFFYSRLKKQFVGLPEPRDYTEISIVVNDVRKPMMYLKQATNLEMLGEYVDVDKIMDRFLKLKAFA